MTTFDLCWLSRLWRIWTLIRPRSVFFRFQSMKLFSWFHSHRHSYMESQLSVGVRYTCLWWYFKQLFPFDIKSLREIIMGNGKLVYVNLGNNLSDERLFTKDLLNSQINSLYLVPKFQQNFHAQFIILVNSLSMLIRRLQSPNLNDNNVLLIVLMWSFAPLMGFVSHCLCQYYC